MSSIAFHWYNRTLRVSGAERALMGRWCSNLATSHPLIPWEKNSTWDRILGGTGRDPRLFVGADLDGHFFIPVLNTAMGIACDDLKLAIRIHAQCEIHGYIEPEDSRFIADRIDGCLRRGMLRRNTFGYDGWGRVMEELRRRDGVCVMSYSVTDEFPPDGYGWDEAVEFLSRSQLRLCQDGWSDYRFGDGHTIIDVYERAKDSPGGQEGRTDAH